MRDKRKAKKEKNKEDRLWGKRDEQGARERRLRNRGTRLGR